MSKHWAVEAGADRLELELPGINATAVRHLLGRGFHIDPWTCSWRTGNSAGSITTSASARRSSCDPGVGSASRTV
jgi:hypothetical protein